MANEHSQIVPSMQPTSTVADFKFWCQKVLPLVYDDSLSYYEVLNKMVVYLNQVIDNINADIDNVAELEDDFLLLQQYVNNFFDDIDQLVTYTERAEAAQTAAATSAINAASSASNAASSASNAASSSGSAATSALSAMDAKDAAVAAKTAAEAALANAQTAATNAAASATAAGNSADAASGSAINAAASAASALQNFQLSDAARVAAQEAATTAEEVLESIPEDYTELADDVSELHSSTVQKAFEIILAKTDAHYNGFVNGETGDFTSSLQWFSTDFIFTPCENLTINCTLLGNGGLAFYDINRQFISGINGNNASDYGFSPSSVNANRNVNVPVNAYFVRACAYIDNNTVKISGDATLNDIILKLSNAKLMQ